MGLGVMPPLYSQDQVKHETERPPSEVTCPQVGLDLSNPSLAEVSPNVPLNPLAELGVKFLPVPRKHSWSGAEVTTFSSLSASVHPTVGFVRRAIRNVML